MGPSDNEYGRGAGIQVVHSYRRSMVLMADMGRGLTTLHFGSQDTDESGQEQIWLPCSCQDAVSGVLLVSWPFCRTLQED